MKKLIVVIIAIIIVAGGVFFYNKKTEENETENVNNNEQVENTEQTTNKVDADENKENNISNNEAINKVENENISNKANVVKNETTNSTNVIKEENTTIKDKVSPSGFMGSSHYRVYLYSNGEVYVVTFDGEGYEDNNIIRKNLIAKNAKSIKVITEGENFGEVVVEGGEAIDKDYGWISFSK